jgi:hypothetical protein
MDKGVGVLDQGVIEEIELGDWLLLPQRNCKTGPQTPAAAH